MSATRSARPRWPRASRRRSGGPGAVERGVPALSTWAPPDQWWRSGSSARSAAAALQDRVWIVGWFASSELNSRWPTTSSGSRCRRRSPSPSAGPRQQRQLAEEVAGPEVLRCLPSRSMSTVPSRITKNSSPGAPCSATTRPAGRSTSSASRLTSSRSRSSGRRGAALRQHLDLLIHRRIIPPRGDPAAFRSRQHTRWVRAGSSRRGGRCARSMLGGWDDSRGGSAGHRRFARPSTNRHIGRLTVAWFAVIAGKWAFLVATLVIAYEAGGAVAVGILGARALPDPDDHRAVRRVARPSRWRLEVVLRATNIDPHHRGRVAVRGGRDRARRSSCLVAHRRARGRRRGVHADRSHGAPAGRRADARAAHRRERHVERGRGTRHVRRAGAGGLLLVVAGPLAATLAVVAIYALGVVAIAGLHVPAVGPRGRSRHGGPGPALGRCPGARTCPARAWSIVGSAFQTFVRGLLTVLIVVAAIEQLGHRRSRRRRPERGDGPRRLAGALGAIGLAGRTGSSPAFTSHWPAWGAPIAVMGLVVDPAVALARWWLWG